ncbi:MAG TPA: SCO family protein [Candidatus Acidoferrales bacterium]|nr:SCO family protein [Candidatus Acidoferrales bacterium]
MKARPNSKTIRRRRCAAVLALWCALSLSGSGAVRAQSPTEVIQQVAFEQRINRPLPLELVFRDEAGRAVALGDYFGRRPVVLALVYYECPMLCTYVLDGLVKSLKPLSFNPGQDFDVVVVSFNPKETPELAAAKKENYVRLYGRPGTMRGWHFLTGEAEAIRGLTEAVGFRYLYDTETQQYAHASGVMVLTPQGKLFRYFYGIDYAPRDLRLALVEASSNKLGTVTDQLLLFCYHYDPTTGKYGLLIMRLLQAMGLATVLALGTFMAAMFRRERRLTAAVARAERKS